MILLCHVRGDFDNSWMGGSEIDEDDAVKQYIVAIYFVTTTLSTCGFGDLSASQGDKTETFMILLLQFIGMLFYSTTIQKVQSFMDVEEITPGEYANYMVEEVENLIVKVGKQLPEDVQIPGDMIQHYRLHTLKYFQGSPNVFLQDNE